MARERSLGKICRNGNSLTVSIPKPMLHRLRWGRGTHVLLEIHNGHLVIAEFESTLEARATQAMATVFPPLAEVAR